MFALRGIGVDIVIGKEPLDVRFVVAAGEADDDDMDVRFAAGIAAPSKRSMGK